MGSDSSSRHISKVSFEKSDCIIPCSTVRQMLRANRKTSLAIRTQLAEAL